MRWGRRAQYIAGEIVLLVVVFFLLAVFSLLCTTDKQDQYLMDWADRSYGWRYEVLLDGGARAYEPVFEDQYRLALPEGTRAVRITRTMTEEIPRAELEWSAFLSGVEVSVDGRLLHSDFQGTDRDADGYLRSAQEELAEIARRQREIEAPRMVRISLPPDYLGKELSMTTYFLEGWEDPQPEYPFLGGDDSADAVLLTESVLPMVTMVICALLALLLAVMFLLDIPNGRADSRTLLLCLYFALLFLDQVYSSYLGYYSALNERMNLSFLSELYVAPLYLYLALRLRRSWKCLLCGLTGAWALSEGVRMALNAWRGQYAAVGDRGLGAFVLFLIVAVALCVEFFTRQEKLDRNARITYGSIAVTVALLCVLNMGRRWNNVGAYLTNGLFTSMRNGNFEPAVHLAADFTAVMATIVLVLEFIRRTLRNREAVTALEERGRLTMESYNRLLAANEAASSARHEMLHHLTALNGILNGGDAERARKYIAAVVSELDQIPAGRYSHNLLVNVIAGTYLDRAQAEGIRVEHNLSVPQELGILDEDLSVFLTNMLQNALEACERMGEDRERYIRVQMHAREGFLFIKCVNSAAQEDGVRAEAHPPERRDHGYGLIAMRRIAEKYDSILVVEQSAGEFCVRSNLSRRQRT